MDIFLSILAFLLSGLGILGAFLPVLPGPALSYAGLLCSFFVSTSTLGAGVMWLWLLITIVVTLIDFYLPVWMAKRFGGSRYGQIGAMIGVVVGIFAGVVGILIGPFLGALLGELIHDHHDVKKATKVGVGSFLAFVVGTGVKLAMSGVVLVLVLGELFP